MSSSTLPLWETQKRGNSRDNVLTLKKDHHNYVLAQNQKVCKSNTTFQLLEGTTKGRCVVSCTHCGHQVRVPSLPAHLRLWNFYEKAIFFRRPPPRVELKYTFSILFNRSGTSMVLLVTCWLDIAGILCLTDSLSVSKSADCVHSSCTSIHFV